MDMDKFVRNLTFRSKMSYSLFCPATSRNGPILIHPPLAGINKGYAQNAHPTRDRAPGCQDDMVSSHNASDPLPARTMMSVYSTFGRKYGRQAPATRAHHDVSIADTIGTADIFVHR